MNDIKYFDSLYVLHCQPAEFQTMFRPVVFLALLALCLASNNPLFVSKKDSKIVGGTAATIEQFPYQISLQLDILGIIRMHRCGGSIISPTWILSAAHCTVDYGVSFYLIRAGSTREASGGQLIAVSQKIEHPNYNIGARYNNDIVLLRLASALTYNNAVRPITLPAAGTQVQSGTYGVITGWGDTFEGSEEGNPTLLQVSVPIMSNAECTRYYAASSITEGMLCAGYQAGGKDSCQGDSGGPLAASGQLVGIVSWGAGCAAANAPGVYARTSYFREWIRSNSGV